MIQQPAARTSTALRALAVGLVLFFVAGFISPGVSAAGQGYRFWSLWSGDGNQWKPVQVSASDFKLSDKSVFAAKFLVAGDSLTPSDAPSEPPRYEALCPNSSGGTGIHVALVLDFGSTADAPPGEKPPTTETECLTLPESATGATALQAAVSVRAGEGGVICGINGYPATQCSVAVAETSPDPTPSSSATKTGKTAKPKPTTAPSVAPAPDPEPASSANTTIWWVGAGVAAILVVWAALTVIRGSSSRGGADDSGTFS